MAKRKVVKKKKVRKKATKKKTVKKKVIKRRKTPKKTKKPPKPKPGRQDLYKKEYAKRAERGIARYGWDDKRMAEEFRVSTRTIQRWRSTSKADGKPAFRKAVAKGKSLQADAIEHNLRLVAMPHDEEVIEYEQGDGEKTNEVVAKRKVKTNITSVKAAGMILAADDPQRFGTRHIKGKLGVGSLKELLDDLDGQSRGLPSEDS